MMAKLLSPRSEYYLDWAIRDYLKSAQITVFSRHYAANRAGFI